MDKILELKWHGKKLWAIIHVLSDTSAGQQLYQRFAEGLPVGISLRAWSSLIPHDTCPSLYTVASDLKFIASVMPLIDQTVLKQRASLGSISWPSLHSGGPF